MKTKIVRIVVLLFIITALAYFGGVFQAIGNRLSPTAYAVGDLTINWGVPSGQPIFTITNLLPGDTESKTVQVTNNATVARPVGVRGIKTSETGNIGTVMTIVIKQGATTLYGPKTLTQFFADSSGPNSIALSTISPGGNASYSFIVTFDPAAGNEYQGKSIVFDLQIGIAIGIPAECANIKFDGNPIFGTQGNDEIEGTNKNDLIFGLEGNDHIDGSNGKDCVVGGPGNDKIDSSNQVDIILGNEGDDKIDGSNGVDIIYGGPGNDRIDASNGNDQIDGGEGDDVIDGSNGNDTIDAGPGNDRIDAGNGNDTVQAGPGNDIMRGANGNDSLIGGTGTDSANGEGGNDTCDAETEVSCEF